MNSPIDAGLCNVTVLGATGRMGGEIIDALKHTPGARLGGAGGRAGHPALGQSLALTDDIVLLEARQALNHAAVAIDFSLPAAVAAHLALCTELRIPYVCGVTGLNDAQRQALDEASKIVPVLWAPNMSPGVNLAWRAAADLAARLPSPVTVTITDIHHAAKVDAPSGTALEFGRQIAAAAAEAPKIDYHSVREGHHPGEHHVVFSYADEQLDLLQYKYERALQ